VKRFFTKRNAVYFTIAIVIFFLILIIWPLPRSIESTPYSKILFSQNNTILAASIAADDQWRFESTANLPEKYRESLLLFEDQHFYQHPGVNPFAILRAIKNNIDEGRVTSGGSTITMQVARMLLQENAVLKGLQPRGLYKKTVEALLALKLEWHFTKDEILILYANHAPFGGNIVGISAASWRYFGRSAEKLSWGEAALLAVLPNSPSMMHLGKQRDELLRKRNRLLKRLFEKKYFSEIDYQLALLEPLPDKPQNWTSIAPHLLTHLQQTYPQTNNFYSTIDYVTQQSARRIVEQHAKRLANDGVHNIALLVIDHEAMQTLAYVGNQAWRGAEIHSSQVDIIQRPRSTGSILKPILYALMLQDGKLAPTSLLPDIPSLFSGYSPENYDKQYRGAVPAQYALAQSLNIPSVHMLRDYGIPQFHEKLKAMGVSSLFRPADDYGLTLILGGAEASLWELTSIYARMVATARSGSAVREQHPELISSPHPNPLSKGRESSSSPSITAPGVILPPASMQSLPRGRLGGGDVPEIKNIIHQGAAWLTLQALIEVTRPGSDVHWRDFTNSQEIAWKTGTSYGLRDAWAIGSNGRYTIGVWAGNASGEPATFLSGTATAAPILFDMFNSLKKASWFEKPEHQLKTILVCKDDGYLAGNQCDAKEIQIPIESHFEKVTPNHRDIHLDKDKKYRVHGECESVSNMQLAHWFVLPPAQEFYWRQQHSEYRSLPPWRADCLQKALAYDNDQPIEIVYPYATSRIYIPVDIDGKLGRIVIKAVHRNSDASLYWHIDNQYLGETKVFHDKTIMLEPGKHRLTILDKQGHQISRVFTVLSRE
jgi:penicillin-binding protein 1C